jgi:hypothetical protein
MRPLVLAVAAMLSLALDPAGSDGRVVDRDSKAPAVSSTDLDRLLAPIALYPDALLSQMLLCAVNSGKVGALREWMQVHPALAGSELQDAARSAGFEESFVA